MSKNLATVKLPPDWASYQCVVPVFLGETSLAFKTKILEKYAPPGFRAEDYVLVSGENPLTDELTLAPEFRANLQLQFKPSPRVRPRSRTPAARPPPPNSLVHRPVAPRDTAPPAPRRTAPPAPAPRDTAPPRARPPAPESLAPKPPVPKPRALPRDTAPPATPPGSAAPPARMQTGIAIWNSPILKLKVNGKVVFNAELKFDGALPENLSLVDDEGDDIANATPASFRDDLCIRFGQQIFEFTDPGLKCDTFIGGLPIIEEPAGPELERHAQLRRESEEARQNQAKEAEGLQRLLDAGEEEGDAERRLRTHWRTKAKKEVDDEKKYWIQLQNASAKKTDGMFDATRGLGAGTTNVLISARSVVTVASEAPLQTANMLARAVVSSKFCIVASAVVTAVECVYYVGRYVNGDITGKTLIKKCSAAVISGGGGFGGAAAGAWIGGMVGTACFPGIGTAVGALIGAAIGGVIFGIGSHKLAEWGLEKFSKLRETDEEKITPKKRKEMFLEACEYMGLDPDESPEVIWEEGRAKLVEHRADKIDGMSELAKQEMEATFIKTYKGWVVVKSYLKHVKKYERPDQDVDAQD